MKNSNPDFSVLLPVYCKEKPQYLRESLDSIFSQTCLPSEIVLIKDGPLTADLESVIKTCAGPYKNLFRFVSLDQSIGLGKALALGVALCKHELIARMDADDICRPTRFEKQTQAFREEPGLDIVGCQIAEFRNTVDDALYMRKLPTRHEAIYRFAKRRNPFNHMTVMFKKESVLSAGNYQEAEGAEDYYLWGRMLKNGCKAKNLDECLVYARADDAFLSRRHGFTYLKSSIGCRKKIYQIHFSSLLDFLVSSTSLAVLSLSPIRLKKWMYRIFLRKEIETGFPQT